jgi:hypothetical protein
MTGRCLDDEGAKKERREDGERRAGASMAFAECLQSVYSSLVRGDERGVSAGSRARDGERQKAGADHVTARSSHEGAMDVWYCAPDM